MLFPEAPTNNLVGIARMAAESPLLESKRRVEYLELPSRSLLGRCSSERMPFDWTINPYRGCEFGCKYCYARYTHEFMELRESSQFEEKIFAKVWSEQSVRRELARVRRNESIAIGTATDPYQPAERRFGLTRKLLTVLARESGRKIGLVTKSDLVARDAGILKEVSRSNVLHVSLTITTTDEDLARLLEPYAPRPSLRLAAVERLAKAGVSVGVLPNPILPLITDSEANLDALAASAKAAGASCIGGGVLFLKPCARQVFLPFLERRFPHLVGRYRERFERTAFLNDAYKEKIRERMARIRERHGLSSSPIDYQPELWEGEPQLELGF